MNKYFVGKKGMKKTSTILIKIKQKLLKLLNLHPYMAANNHKYR